MDKNQNQSKIRMHVPEEEKKEYKKEYEQRHGMEPRNRILLRMGICTVIVYFLVILLPTNVFVGLGSESLARCVEQIRNNVMGISLAFGGNGNLKNQYTLFRYLAVALTGATLSLCGAVYQGSFKNALASPSTLGVQSGGVLGGTLYIMLFSSYGATEVLTYQEFHQQLENMNIFQRYAQGFSILLGCFLGVVFIITVSKVVGRGKVSSIALIMSGTVFGSLISSCVGLVQYWLLMNDPYGTRTYELRFMMLGTFDYITSFVSLLLLAIPLIIGITVIMLMRGRLNLLVFGEDEAKSMGIRVELTRNVMIGVVTVLTAVVISFCGQIGFVGFIVPHLARRFVGPDFRYLIPGSAILGALCMMVVYYIATLIGYASNINVVTSLVGGLAFLVMIMRFRNKRYADWA